MIVRSRGRLRSTAGGVPSIATGASRRVGFPAASVTVSRTRVLPVGKRPEKLERPVRRVRARHLVGEVAGPRVGRGHRAGGQGRRPDARVVRCGVADAVARLVPARRRAAGRPATPSARSCPVRSPACRRRPSRQRIAAVGRRAAADDLAHAADRPAQALSERGAGSRPARRTCRRDPEAVVAGLPAAGPPTAGGGIVDLDRQWSPSSPRGVRVVAAVAGLAEAPAGEADDLGAGRRVEVPAPLVSHRATVPSRVRSARQARRRRSRRPRTTRRPGRRTAGRR